MLIVFLTLLNGVFAMSELALAASRKARLNAMSEAGDKGAKAALILLSNPNQFLSTVQVGITSIGVLNGIVGEAAFSGGVAVWLMGWGMKEAAAAFTATALVVTVITFTTIIFGELVPKRIGQLYPEPVARLVARPMAWLAGIAKPFVSLLSITTHGVLKLLRIDTTGNRAVTEEEITASLEEEQRIQKMRGVSLLLPISNRTNAKKRNAAINFVDQVFSSRNLRRKTHDVQDTWEGSENAIQEEINAILQFIQENAKKTPA